jgi:ubiquinone/menaquinone biosynthesis C-methylase UbiE
MTQYANNSTANIIAATFNNLAKTYENIFTYDSFEKQKINSLIKLFDIKPGFRILEVGGGTGDLTPFLLKSIRRHGSVVFLDIAVEMVKVARRKLAKWENIKFIAGDFHCFESKQLFDRIIIFNTFPHFYNKKVVLNNCYKLLNPGGKLIICHNESRMSISLHHAKKNVSLKISDFPEDSVVYKLLIETGFRIELFENNEGYNYYLVKAVK